MTCDQCETWPLLKSTDWRTRKRAAHKCDACDKQKRTMPSPVSADWIPPRQYERPEPGEWILPVTQAYRFQCCDCGLVHRLDFRVHNGRAEFRAFRDESETARLREAK